MKIRFYALILSLLLAVPGIQAATAASTTNPAGEKSMQPSQADAGIVTLPSGLQYKVIEQGTGKKPRLNDSVTVHYKGTLENGTVFDSSYDRGQPATFPVSGVIAGWVEALQLMNVGSTWMLYIPSKLAYGERGVGGVIGPNQKLIFKVHLISIQ